MLTLLKHERRTLYNEVLSEDTELERLRAENAQLRNDLRIARAIIGLKEEKDRLAEQEARLWMEG